MLNLMLNVVLLKVFATELINTLQNHDWVKKNNREQEKERKNKGFTVEQSTLKFKQLCDST